MFETFRRILDVLCMKCFVVLLGVCEIVSHMYLSLCNVIDWFGRTTRKMTRKNK